MGNIIEKNQNIANSPQMYSTDHSVSNVHIQLHMYPKHRPQS